MHRVNYLATFKCKPSRNSGSFNLLEPRVCPGQYRDWFTFIFTFTVMDIIKIISIKIIPGMKNNMDISDQVMCAYAKYTSVFYHTKKVNTHCSDTYQIGPCNYVFTTRHSKIRHLSRMVERNYTAVKRYIYTLQQLSVIQK